MKFGRRTPDETPAPRFPGAPAAMDGSQAVVRVDSGATALISAPIVPMTVRIATTMGEITRVSLRKKKSSASRLTITGVTIDIKVM